VQRALVYKSKVETPNAKGKQKIDTKKVDKPVQASKKKKVAAEPESTPQKSKAQKDKQVLFVTTFDNMIIPNTIHNVNLRILRLWHGKLCGPNSLPSNCFIGVDEMVNKI